MSRLINYISSDSFGVEVVVAGNTAPGSLLLLTSSLTYSKSTTILGDAPILVCGVEPTAAVGAVVPSGYRVIAWSPRKGGVVLLNAVSGQNYAIGDRLYGHADGTVTKVAATGAIAIAVAQENLDISATGAVNTLIKVRII